MFEEEVKKAVSKISEDKSKLKDFYVLTHKKHKREIYFEKDDSLALKWIKIKFPSFGKKIIYWLIKTRVLKPFIKKIKLPGDRGSVIFVAGQIKIFDLKKKEVYSFPKNKLEEKEFLESKSFQKKIGKQGFAPEIIEIDKKLIYSREELTLPNKLIKEKDIFKRLLEYYKATGITKHKSLNYLNKIEKELKQNLIGGLFLEVVQDLKKKNFNALIVARHGDFAREQCLKGGKNIVFVDWNPSRGTIVSDIINYFDKEEDLLNNKIFLDLIKLYPREVQENIRDYIILNELETISEISKRGALAGKRIRNLKIE